MKKTQGGMSLVEVLLALAILAFVLLSTAGLFSQAIGLNATGMDYTTVNSYARDRLEQLIALPFDNTAIRLSTWTEGADAVMREPDSDTLPPGSPFRRSYEVRTYRLAKTEDSGTWQEQLETLVAPTDSGLVREGNIREITVIVDTDPHRPFLGHREIRVSALKCNGLL